MVGRLKYKTDFVFNSTYHGSYTANIKYYIEIVKHYGIIRLTIILLINVKTPTVVM